MDRGEIYALLLDRACPDGKLTDYVKANAILKSKAQKLLVLSNQEDEYKPEEYFLQMLDLGIPLDEDGILEILVNHGYDRELAPYDDFRPAFIFNLAGVLRSIRLTSI
jgi:hypothetical protein